MYHKSAGIEKKAKEDRKKKRQESLPTAGLLKSAGMHGSLRMLTSTGKKRFTRIVSPRTCLGILQHRTRDEITILVSSPYFVNPERPVTYEVRKVAIRSTAE